MTKIYKVSLEKPFCKVAVGVAAVIFAFSAHGFTTNVSTVAELAGALLHMNENYRGASLVHTLILKKGSYDVRGLNLQYYHSTNKEMTDSGANLGMSQFTMRGETDNPRDVVIYRSQVDGEDPEKGLKLIYNYAGMVRNLTLSNCTTTADRAIHSHSGNTFWSNVIVTCCSAARYGASSSGTWYDCQFIGNTAKNYGGALYNSKAYGCTFEGNTADSGGATYGTMLSNCTVRANTALESGGGVCSGAATNCVIEGNSASSGGGAYSCLVSSCNVSSNTAVNGGGTYNCTVLGSVVACNDASNLGGGCCGSELSWSVIGAGSVVSNNTGRAGAGGAYRSIVNGSRICMNFADGSRVNGAYSCGGGAYECVITDSLIDGNAVTKGRATSNTLGGGAYNSVLTNCVVRNNYVDALGGGIESGSAYGCVISNNVSKSINGSGGARRVSIMENCDIYENAMDPQGVMVNCRIMNYTNGNVIAEGANIYTNGWMPGPTVLVKSWCMATNCLVAGNRVMTLIGGTGTKCTTYSSCTFADNRYRYMTSGYQGPTNVLTLINCIIARNKDQTGASDLNFNPTFTYMALTNCVVGSMHGSDAESLAYPSVNIVTNNNPRFVDDGSRDSYALSPRSPAVGKGLVQDWMEGAFDIRHDAAYPRLRDGLVDIGCYECWLNPPGTQFIIR